MILFYVLCILCLTAGCGNSVQNEVTPSPTMVYRSYECTPPLVTDVPSRKYTPIPTATPSPTATPVPTVTNTSTPTISSTPTPDPLDITICFAGDISLAEDAVTIRQWKDAGQNLDRCISPELLETMKRADIMCVNNEFTFSDRGEPMKGKMYTFRAKPERVSLLKEMGVDLALLANNHVFDYGKEAILDTFDTLETAGIGYFGAGRNLEEAMSPYYVEADGITIAFVAASRAEKNVMTPQATETEPGILRCYDTALFLETIKEADANADIVLACVHWGTEYSTVLEEVQLTTGKLYLDAGADVIIGSHSHCLQGMEFYNGKPVIYSLGNFWFNKRTLQTMLLELHIVGERENPQIEVTVIPAVQQNNTTTILTGQEEIEKLYQHLEDISVNVEIDSDGVVREIGLQ